MNLTVPKEVMRVAETLEGGGFKAYLVGGCVRDVLLKRKPGDWDIATNATPEEIQKLFVTFSGATADKPATVYENDFGTVGIKTDAEDPRLKIIEVTTFRREGRYTDKRHPDDITFAKTIEEDLARRDFTVNAIAIGLHGNEKEEADHEVMISGSSVGIVDPFQGVRDVEEGIIRAVGDPHERFREDALRLMRAVRLAAQLGFEIEEKTAEALEKNVTLIEYIAKERVRDEFEKLLMSDGAVGAIETMREIGLLRFVLPELEDGVGVGQNKHHIYTVYEHNLKSLEYAVSKKFPLHLRIASLLHDVGKPQTKRGDGLDSTFYGHQVVGERIAIKMLDRLRFPKHLVEQVALLVREHMFVYDPEVVTLAGVRRLLRRVGPENIDDLIKVREADRIGSGVPKAQPYRLRHLQAMIEKVQKDPLSPKMLQIRGDTVMEILKMPPGPRIGKILAVLLDEVIDDPSLNEGDRLTDRVKELGRLDEERLDALAEKAKEKTRSAQERIDDEIKKKYFVK